MKNRIIRILRKIRNLFIDRYATKSYSQEGEDIFLTKYFPKKYDGFFVDVGAHHPKRYSNTYLLYKKGWQGINIEPRPDSIRHFQKVRPRDVNIEAAVANSQRTMTYHMFNISALNTFSVELAEQRLSNPANRLTAKKNIKTVRLIDVLENHAANQVIDLLNIDVEGLDYEVLESNDWNKFRPSLVMVECLGIGDVASLIKNDKTVKFMRENDYLFFAKTFNTVFFKDLRN